MLQFQLLKLSRCYIVGFAVSLDSFTSPNAQTPSEVSCGRVPSSMRRAICIRRGIARDSSNLSRAKWLGLWKTLCSNQKRHKATLNLFAVFSYVFILSLTFENLQLPRENLWKSPAKESSLPKPSLTTALPSCLSFSSSCKVRSYPRQPLEAVAGGQSVSGQEDNVFFNVHFSFKHLWTTLGFLLLLLVVGCCLLFVCCCCCSTVRSQHLTKNLLTFARVSAMTLKDIENEWNWCFCADNGLLYNK